MAASAIIQGEQYLVPFIIRQGDTVITPEMATGVKAAIGKYVCSWPSGNLVYADDMWWFPLTRRYTNSLPEGTAEFQVQVKFGDKIGSTKKRIINVDESIIKGDWD